MSLNEQIKPKQWKAPASIAAASRRVERQAASTNTEEGIETLPFIVPLYMVTVVVPIFFSVGPLVMTTLRLLLLIIIVPLMVRLFRGDFGRVRAVDVLFLLHLFWAAVALQINNPGQTVQQVGSVGIEFFGGYAVGRAYVRTSASFLALCRLLAWSVCLLAPAAFFELLTGKAVLLTLLNALPVVGSVGDAASDPRLGLERVQLTFSTPIHWGLYCSVVFSFVFVALKDSIGTGKRWILGLVVAFCGFASLSSGALLAMVLQFFLIFWYSALVRHKWRWWALIGLFVLAYIVVDLISNRTPYRVFMSYATFSPGTAYWRSITNEWVFDNVIGNAEKNITGHPFFGIGLNDWVRPVWMYSSSVDNFWLISMLRYGFPGFLFLVFGYFITIGRIMIRDFSDDPILTLVRRAWVFTFLGLSFTLYTVHVWTNIYSFIFFIFGAGVWLMGAVPFAPGEKEALQKPQGRLSSPYTRFPAAVPARMIYRHSV